MSRAGQLYDLQQIDSGLDSRVSRIRQIDESLAASPEVETARKAKEYAEGVLKKEQARLSELSLEADDTSIRQKKLGKRLYDGTIKNPKELGQMQEEVEHLKGRLRALEDEMLEAMVATDEAEAVLRSREAELDVAEKERQHFEEGLAEERDKLLSQAKVLQVKRQRAIEDIPWEDLQMYERMRRGKGGTAVAAVREGRCGGCGVDVPAHVLRQARISDQLITCPSCGRIIYPIGEIRYHAFDHDLDNVDR